MRKLLSVMGSLFVTFYLSAQSNDILWVSKLDNGKYGLINRDKKVVVDYAFDEIKKLKGERVCFRTKRNGKYGLLDGFGKEAIIPSYDEITLRTQATEWIETKLNGKYGFAGFRWSAKFSRYEIKEIFQPKYDDTFYRAGEGSGSGYINVKLNNKWGLVDELTGKEITGMKYDEVNDFFFWQGHNLADVKLNNKYGFIDKTGREVIPCIYDELVDIDLEKNRILVKQGAREFYIDKTGKNIN